MDAATTAKVVAGGAGSTIPLALDADGSPMQRNFVHVNDLVSCMLAALGNPAAKQQKVAQIIIPR